MVLCDYGRAWPSQAHSDGSSRQNQVCQALWPLPWYGLLFCALVRPGHIRGLEPDAWSRLLRHLSYAWTTLDFQERDLDGAGRHGVMLMSTSVLVQGPFVTSL